MTTETSPCRDPNAGASLQVLCESATRPRQILAGGQSGASRRDDVMLAPVLVSTSLAPIEMPSLQDSDEALAASLRRRRFSRLVAGVMGLCAAIGVAAIGTTVLARSEEPPRAGATMKEPLANLPFTKPAASATPATLTVTNAATLMADAPTAKASPPATTAHPAKKKWQLRAQPAAKHQTPAAPAPSARAPGSPSSLEELMRPVSHGNTRP